MRSLPSSRTLVSLSSRMALAASVFSAAPMAHAHSFGKVYTLPVPVWLYLYGAAAALILSFLVVGYFVNARSADLNLRSRNIAHVGVLQALLHPAAIGLAQLLSVSGLLLTILSGLIGTADSYRNFNMTFFWIVFVLGYTYLIALAGNSYAAINPWKVLCLWAEKLRPGLFSGVWTYPERWAYWPALGLYMAFIWFELFGEARPYSTSMALAVYTGLTLGGAFLFGRRAWFRYAEFFAVFLSIVGMMAPLYTRRNADSGRRELHLRQPFIGLNTNRVTQLSLLVFVLFMLSSTAFDGVKSTVPYVRIYWVHVAGWLKPLVGDDIVQSFPLLKAIYTWWQVGVLVLSPFLYLAVYLFFIWLTKLVSRCELSVRELSLRFAFSLVPIAFVYHVTHYYGLLLSQGTQVLKLLSDPFGWGWNVLGTADLKWNVVVQAGTVWHTQVWLILFGHIVSVYLAHLEALRIFPDSRRAALSQLPMLLLMVVLTTVGLWILSLPISRGAG